MKLTKTRISLNSPNDFMMSKPYRWIFDIIKCSWTLDFSWADPLRLIPFPYYIRNNWKHISMNLWKHLTMSKLCILMNIYIINIIINLFYDPVVRISKYIILAYKNTVIISLSFFRFLLSPLAFYATAFFIYKKLLDVICVDFYSSKHNFASTVDLSDVSNATRIGKMSFWMAYFFINMIHTFRNYKEVASIP